MFSIPAGRNFVIFGDFSKNVSKNLSFFKNLSRRTGNLREHMGAIMIIYRWILLTVKKFLDKVVEEIKRMIFLGKRAVCEIARKNMVQPDSPQMTVKHTARIIKKRIHTLSEYVSIYCCSTARMVTRTSIDVLSYVHCLSCSGINKTLRNIRLCLVVTTNTERWRARKVTTSCGLLVVNFPWSETQMGHRRPRHWSVQVTAANLHKLKLGKVTAVKLYSKQVSVTCELRTIAVWILMRVELYWKPAWRLKVRVLDSVYVCDAQRLRIICLGMPE